MKRIDTHSHPKISRHFAFDAGSVTRMVRMARRVGLDGVALTEHFHARGYWDIAAHLEATWTSPYTPFRVKAAKSLKNITKVLRKCYGAGGGSPRGQSIGVPAGV